MNWLFGVATIVVTMAVVFRLLRWAVDRPHRLASQGQSSLENPTELSKTGHVAELNDKVPGEAESESQRSSQ
jgi:hypothetical protein